MRNRLFGLLAVALLIGATSGCATAIKLSERACDAVLSGSAAGDICSEIDKLKADEVAAEAPDAEAAPADAAN